jgi:hypothetical protein
MADRVKPIVDLLFPCDGVDFNDKTGRYTLHHPWQSTVQMPAGVTEDFILVELCVFAQVLDGVGEFQFSIEVRNEAGLRVARSQRVTHEFGINERLTATQFAFRLQKVAFAKPGVYRIHLLAGEAELENGFKDLRVLPG